VRGQAALELIEIPLATEPGQVLLLITTPMKIPLQEAHVAWHFRSDLAEAKLDLFKDNQARQFLETVKNKLRASRRPRTSWL
jgi:hypothetical protein